VLTSQLQCMARGLSGTITLVSVCLVRSRTDSSSSSAARRTSLPEVWSMRSHLMNLAPSPPFGALLHSLLARPD
jgi:hypothetical protein